MSSLIPLMISLRGDPDDDDDDDDDYDDSDDLKLFSPCFLDLQICRTDRNPDL